MGRPGIQIKRSMWSGAAGAASRRLWFLDAAGLCAKAAARTGLEDFGEPGVEPALSVLAESLEAEAELRPLGRLLMRIHLLDLLETRLRLAAVWKERAGASEAERIEKPLFIIG